MDKQPRMIDADKLLKDLHAKMDRTEGERQRGIAGVVGAVESGKYDPDPIPLPTINQYDTVKHSEYGKGWVKNIEGADALVSFKELDYDLLLPIKQLEVYPL